MSGRLADSAQTEATFLVTGSYSCHHIAHGVMNTESNQEIEAVEQAHRQVQLYMQSIPYGFLFSYNHACIYSLSSCLDDNTMGPSLGIISIRYSIP